MADIVYLKNRAEFIAAMQKLKSAPSGNALVSIATASILPIQNAAIVFAPYVTGTLRRSIHTQTISADQWSAHVATGTDVVYARRVEYGFSGADSLGRNYHQPAKPFMRPAYAERRDESVATAQTLLRALVLGAT